MDPQMFGNLAVLFAVLVQQFGLFDAFFDGTEFDTGAIDDPNDPDPFTGSDPDPLGIEDPDPLAISDPELGEYVAANFSTETFGTNGDDLVKPPEDTFNQALFALDGDDRIDATGGNDYAEGGGGNDLIEMYQGDDIAKGGLGDDTIDGGIGFDTIFGGDGDDEISGGKGSDTLLGDSGNDTLIGSTGADVMHGGFGNDILYGYSPSDPSNVTNGFDTLIGGDGDDTLTLAMGDTGTGGAGSDSFQIYQAIEPVPNIATISDFEPTQDQIVLTYQSVTDPSTGAFTDPDVAIAVNPDGTGAMISVDGTDVATITGGQSLTPADIALVMASP